MTYPSANYRRVVAGLSRGLSVATALVVVYAAATPARAQRVFGVDTADVANASAESGSLEQCIQ